MTRDEQQKVVENLNSVEEDLEKTEEVLKELERKDATVVLEPIITSLRLP